jgi:hypothetical protein
MEISHSDMIRRYDVWLFGLMAIPGFYTYARQAYDYLEVMKPGTIMKLQETEDKLPWLLVTVGAFLAAGQHWMDYETSDDYTKLRRKPLPENFRKAMAKA